MTETTMTETTTKKNGKTIDAIVDATHEAFEKLSREMSARLLARGEEIIGLLTALLASENIVLLGPPGTAKSMIARALVAGLGGASYFETLLSRYSTPEQLFGPVSLTGLQQDRFVRVTSGYLPDAKVAFLDEIFKAGPGVLNTLLPVLNERVFHDEGRAKPVPLSIAIAASNEMPEGESLAALWDRFPLRFWVSPLASDEDRFKLETMAAKGWDPMPSCVTFEQLERAREQVKTVVVSETIIRAKLKLRREMEKEGLVSGDRRWVKATRLLQAHAWLRGSKNVSTLDFEVLQHALWDKPEQRSKVAEIVRRAGGDASKARNIADAALESTVGWEAQPVEERSQHIPKLTRARRELKTMWEKADADVGARIKQEHARVTARRKAIVDSISDDADLTSGSMEVGDDF